MDEKILLTQALLRQLLSYDPETGVFTWLPRPGGMFTKDRLCKRWNARYALKEAGYIRRNGYKCLTFFDVDFRAHRLAWLYVHGEPVPAQLDHIDRNRLNNRITNLRAATKAQNRINSGPQKNNKLGTKGVYAAGGKFHAAIIVSGRSVYLGRFLSLDDAATAYREAAVRYFGEFAIEAQS